MGPSQAGHPWSANTGFAHILSEPFERPSDNVNGWWFVSEVGGTEFEEVFLPLNMTVNFNLFFTANQYVNFGVAPPHDGRRIARGSNSLPANSVVKVYQAVSGTGEQGIPGPPGTSGTSGTFRSDWTPHS